MVSKSDIAISYLIAVGLGLFAALAIGILIPRGGRTSAADGTLVFGLICGVLIAFGFLVSGVILAKNELTGARPSRIAIWGTAGLGLPALLTIAIVTSSGEGMLGLEWEQVVMLSIAGGGIIGILSGTLFELQAAHEHTSQLNERNSVYLRLFRHDIRNSLNIIQGQLELMRSDLTSPTDAAAAIDDQLEHIIRLSDAAHKLDDLDRMETQRPIDLAALTRDRIAHLRDIRPKSEIRTDIQPSVIVIANRLLASVVENLLHNSVEHHPADPTIEVTVKEAPEDPDWAILRVADDGPGFTEEELDLYTKGFETALHHSNGVGLWLAHWIVESAGGKLSISNTERGALVTARLPTANHPD